MEEVSLRRGKIKRRKVNGQIVQKKRWINRVCKNWQLWGKTKEAAWENRQREEAITAKQYLSERPFGIPRDHTLAWNLSSLNHEDQKLERSKASVTLKLFPDWITLNHMIVTLWRVWKKVTLPIPCLLPAAVSFRLLQLLLQVGVHFLHSFMFAYLS